MFFVSVGVHRQGSHINENTNLNGMLLQNITKYHKTLVNRISKNHLVHVGHSPSKKNVLIVSMNAL